VIRKGRHLSKYLDSKPSVLVNETDFPFLEALDSRFGPPVGESAVFVVMSSVLVETMADLMTSHRSKATQVQKVEVVWIFAPGEKGWKLQNSSWENNL